MKARDLLKLGFKQGPAIGVALKVLPDAKRAMGARMLENDLKSLVSEPNAYKDHPHLSLIAQTLLDEQARQKTYVERDQPAPYQIWGEGLEAGAIEQMTNAARLPVAVAGALMPDAHQGYGLPIGGVLATDNAVIPYAVGVDIACRMKLSILDVPARDIKRLREQLKRALETQTRFGVGAEYQKPLDHPVLEEDWSVTPVTQRLFDKARAQLGTSGSGNHFVEWGVLSVPEGSGFEVPSGFGPQGRGQESVADGITSLPSGEYLALLSHSGSRGTGAAVANHYSRLAMDLHPELPPELRRLAWLDLDSDAGREYWAAMHLMGDYASANHALIHQRVIKALGGKLLVSIENHHNFAWRETHNGREVIVHRKGATPAGVGVLGVIPGSMASPGFVVAGKGNEAALSSASHGAGRAMSRTQARNRFRWAHIKPLLEKAQVELLSAGIDEVPLAYKDIHSVMSQQSDLVNILARFDPRMVKMAPAGEAPED